MLLGIAGMIGSGKTTLTQALATRFGLQHALESVDADNPWLDKFYSGSEGMHKYGMHLQLHFLATRFRMSGGNIRNVCVGAAYLAAAEGRPVGMDPLSRATEREYRKLGRLTVEAEFGSYFGLVRG